MRIFLFLSLSFFIWGCSTVKVTKEVIKVTNTITDKVKKSVPQKENNNKTILKEIFDEKKIEEEINMIEEKKEEGENIVKSQQKLAEINFIGKSESEILNLLGISKLARVDGSVLTLRYDSKSCRLFLFFDQKTKNKRVEYFELRNINAELLNSKKSLGKCYKEFNLTN